MYVIRLLNKNDTRRALLTNYFAEFMWYRKLLKNNADPCAVFLNHVALYDHILLLLDEKYFFILIK